MGEAEQPQRQLSRLESLPGELRNVIYRLAVAEDQPIWATHNTYSDDHNRYNDRKVVVVDNYIWADLDGTRVDNTHATDQHQLNEPGLAMTCKQIRTDVLPIFFATNTFAFFLQRRDLFRVIPNEPRLSTLSKATAMSGWLNSTGDLTSNVRKVNLQISMFERGPVEMQLAILDSGCCVQYDTHLGDGLRLTHVKTWCPQWTASATDKQKVEAALFTLLKHVASKFKV